MALTHKITAYLIWLTTTPKKEKKKKKDKDMNFSVYTSNVAIILKLLSSCCNDYTSQNCGKKDPCVISHMTNYLKLVLN
jgi:hypothetical protein